MTESRNAILESFYRALTVPTMHLMKQFIHPGSKDVDDKQTAADAKDDPVMKPMLTREEALSRLQCRIENGFTPEDHAGCKDYLQKLDGKLPGSCSNSEKLLLGLAYKYALGGIPHKSKKALEQFKSAIDEQDDNNGYALTFVTQSLRNNSLDEKDETQEYCKYSRARYAAKPLGLVLAHNGISDYNRHLSLALSTSKTDQSFANRFYKLAQEQFKKSASRKHYIGAHNLGCMYAIDKDTTKRPEGEKYLKDAIAQGCSDSIAAYAQYYIAEADIRKEWLVIAEKHGGVYAARQVRVDHMSPFVRSTFEQASRYAYHTPPSLEQLIDAAAHFRFWSILDDKEHAKLLFKEMKELHLVTLRSQQALSNGINYHYALAFNDESDLYYLLKHDPQLFVNLWEKDYKNPLHPKMKEQAVACVLQIDPTKLSPEANGLLAAALAQCSEKDLKDKADKFSAEKATQDELQKKAAAMDAKSAAALPALSLVQQAGAQGAAAASGAKQPDVETNETSAVVGALSSLATRLRLSTDKWKVLA